MKLTSQEEYGLRCILALARCADDRSPRPSLTLSQIAETESLSCEYAGKLMGILGRAGLVESVRGRNGGYRLARAAHEVSLADALAALGGKLYAHHETCGRFAGDQDLCVHTNGCSVRSLWSGLQRLIDHVLMRTTLADLVRLSERNVAGWMKSHLEALDELEPLGALEGVSSASATERANVVFRNERR